MTLQEPDAVIKQTTHYAKARGMEALKVRVSTEYLRMMVDKGTYGFIPWENDGTRSKDEKQKKSNGTQTMELKKI